MRKFEEIINELNESLKTVLTADNSETMVKISGNLNELKERNNFLEGENLKLKDKIVDVIGNTHFKEEPKDENQNEPLSLDEAINKELENLQKGEQNK